VGQAVTDAWVRQPWRKDEVGVLFGRKEKKNAPGDN
jgi:hypothetical protein